jgi:exopolysaccharide biosynthesis polyprenyl glycosylphosphotransferase
VSQVNEEPLRAKAAGDIRARRALLAPSPLRSLLRRLTSVLALILLDVTGLTLGLYGGLVVRELVRGEWPPLWGFLWQGIEEWLPFLALVTLLVFWQAGLYAEREFRPGVGRILPATILVALLTTAFALASGHEFSSYGLVPTAAVLTVIAITLLRASYEAVTRDIFRFAGVKRRAVVVGDEEGVDHLRRTLGSGRSGINYEFLAAVAPGDLRGLLEREHVDELIVSQSGIGEQELLELVEDAHAHGIDIRVAPTTTELLTRRAEYVPGQGVPLFELRAPVFAGADWIVKRSFDILVSSAVLVLGLPLWLAIAAAIKLDSPGPVLYRDPRIGLGERSFRMLKFRTMRAGAADLQPELERSNEASGALFKIRDDPRVTRVGALLRRFSLDELPQVLNVLRGEMSLVGPRPLPVRDFQLLEAWHKKRYLVLPGMTGLWQISGRSSLSFDDLVRLDFYYLENWSIWLDIAILLKTVPAVLARRGAY